jgi:hypothetical protein
MPFTYDVNVFAAGEVKRRESPALDQQLPKGWAEAAASLLGPVAQRVQLTSAFSEALAAHAGMLPAASIPWHIAQPLLGTSISLRAKQCQPSCSKQLHIGFGISFSN